MPFPFPAITKLLLFVEIAIASSNALENECRYSSDHSHYPQTSQHLLHCNIHYSTPSLGTAPWLGTAPSFQFNQRIHNPHCSSTIKLLFPFPFGWDAHFWGDWVRLRPHLHVNEIFLAFLWRATTSFSFSSRRASSIEILVFAPMF